MASGNRIFLIIALAVLMCLQAGCEKKSPTLDERFVNTYTELLIAEQMYGKDSPTARLKRKKILSDAGYNREQFLKKADEILGDYVPEDKIIDKYNITVGKRRKARAKAGIGKLVDLLDK